jgi:hypothetical protein
MSTATALPPASSDHIPDNATFLFSVMRRISLLAVSLLALTYGQEEVNFAGEVNSDSPASDPIPADPNNNAFIFY